MRRFNTRYYLAVLLAVCLFQSPNIGWTQSAKDLKFPYEALVLRDGATVRSGPDKVHYPTDKLEQGFAVEVHRHDPFGWCAIRPPLGSFSLVPESAIETVDEGMGKVLTSSAQAWVGTRLGSVDSPLWQIKLKQDEIVEVLGEVSWPSPDGHSTIWLQIAPPAGEFRWIHMSDLQLPHDSTRINNLTESQPQIATSTHQASLPSPAPATMASPIPNRKSPTPRSGVYEPPAEVSDRIPQTLTTRREHPSPNANSDAQHSTAASGTPPTIEDTLPSEPPTSLGDGWRRRKTSFEKDAAVGQVTSTKSPNQFTSPAVPSEPTRVAGTFESFEPAVQSKVELAALQQGTGSTANRRYASTDDPWGILPDARPVAESASAQAGPLSVRIRAIELSLTNEMLKEPAEWKLEPLKLTAESLRDQSTNPAETQQATRLIEKLKQCEGIRANYRKVYSSDPLSNFGPERSYKGAVGTGIDPNVEFGTNYDAHGVLNELVRDKGSVKSTYVLQDENGKITHHLSPAPGVNLHRYIGSKIGVVGRRGFHQRLNLDHVTAERVIELNKMR